MKILNILFGKQKKHTLNIRRNYRVGDISKILAKKKAKVAACW